MRTHVVCGCHVIFYELFIKCGRAAEGDERAKERGCAPWCLQKVNRLFHELIYEERVAL